MSLAGFDFGSFVTALVGAFAGGLAAYLFGKQKDQELKEDNRYSQLISAQVTLVSQINSLKQIWITYLAPFETSERRHVDLKKLYHSATQSRIEINDLSFLAETGNPQDLLTLGLSQGNYFGVIDAIGKRNACYDETFSDIVHHDASNNQAIVKIDPLKLKHMKERTDDLYEGCSKTMMELKNSVELLARRIKSDFEESKRALVVE